MIVLLIDWTADTGSAARPQALDKGSAQSKSRYRSGVKQTPCHPRKNIQFMAQPIESEALYGRVRQDQTGCSASSYGGNGQGPGIIYRDVKLFPCETLSQTQLLELFLAVTGT
ncbi:MAG TPA: hypothetical protein GX696_07885 [Pseudomonadaceae bacterium]|jgi:hypothetical protein|nr:hypothetical protein [Pseudomonadaceae bacterium]